MTASITTLKPSNDTQSLLVARAERLQAEASAVHPLLASTYRRRAAELRLEAWARAARLAPADVDAFTTTTTSVAA